MEGNGVEFIVAAVTEHGCWDEKSGEIVFVMMMMTMMMMLILL